MSKKEKNKITRNSDLAGDVLSAINNQFKDIPSAMSYLSDANLINNWGKTGCKSLDLIISNRKNAGIGYGVICEIFGLPGSSKSLLSAHIMAECQKDGGLAVIYDTEKAIGMLDFYTSIGLDPSKVLYTDSLRALEDIFESVELIVSNTIKNNSDKKIVIVIDSLMGATTRLEQDAKFDKEGYATAKAIVLSKAMRKLPDLIKGRNILIICTNQLRENVGAIGFGVEKYKTSGGLAPAFSASVRIKLSVVKKIKNKLDGVDVEVGNIVEAKIVKNRLGPPGKSIKYLVYYDSGIDDDMSFLLTLKDYGVVNTSGSYNVFEYVDENAELITVKFLTSDFKKLLTNKPILRDILYESLSEKVISPYHPGGESGNEIYDNE